MSMEQNRESRNKPSHGQLVLSKGGSSQHMTLGQWDIHVHEEEFIYL